MVNGLDLYLGLMGLFWAYVGLLRSQVQELWIDFVCLAIISQVQSR